MAFQLDTSDDDLPEIKLSLDSHKSESSKDDFEMPEADVLLAQRQHLAKQLEEIEKGRESIDEMKITDQQDEKEIAAVDLDPLPVPKRVGYMPKHPPVPLNSIFVHKEIAFLSVFIEALHRERTTNAMDTVVDFILSTLEQLVHGPYNEKFMNTETPLVATLLSIICVCEACSHLVNILGRARTLLYFLLEHVCEDNDELFQTATAIRKMIVFPEHRLELISILEGREGLYIKMLAVSLVHRSIDEILLDEVDDTLMIAPYRVGVLLELLSKKWATLEFKQQYVLAELVSKNLKQMEDFYKDEENKPEERAKLLALLTCNIDKNADVNDKCKLQILVSRIQIYQSNFVDESKDDDENA